MFYNYTISTPANTLESAPVHTKLKLTQGIIDKWTVFFPVGSGGLLEFRLTRGTETIFPVNKDSSIRGENFFFEAPEFLHLKQPPFEVDCYSWSPGTSYEHEFVVGISINPLWTKYPFSEEYFMLLKQEHIARTI
jgi:hypothetical protein